MTQWPVHSTLATVKNRILQTYQGVRGVATIRLRRSDKHRDAQAQHIRPEGLSATGSHSTTLKCTLLALPAELRTYIFQLSFTEAPSVDFLHADPPSKALTLTCHQIHSETAQMYKAAYRSFWTETEFTIDLFRHLAPPSEARSSIPTIRADIALQQKVCTRIRDMNLQDLKHITKVHVTCSGTRDYGSWTLSNGSWALWSPLPDTPLHCSHMLFFPVEKIEALERAGFEPLMVGRVSRLFSTLVVHAMGWEDVEKAEEIIGRTVLDWEELMLAVRHVCADYVWP